MHARRTDGAKVQRLRRLACDSSTGRVLDWKVLPCKSAESAHRSTRSSEARRPPRAQTFHDSPTLAAPIRLSLGRSRLGLQGAEGQVPRIRPVPPQAPKRALRRLGGRWTSPSGRSRNTSPSAGRFTSGVNCDDDTNTCCSSRDFIGVRASCHPAGRIGRAGSDLQCRVGQRSAGRALVDLRALSSPPAAPRRRREASRTHGRCNTTALAIYLK